MHQVTLGAFLGRWRQGQSGTCHTYATFLTARASNENQMLKNYNEVLLNGMMERRIDNQQYAFKALPKVFPFSLERELAKELSKKKASEFAEKLSMVPNLAYAFSILGVEKNDEVAVAILSLQTRSGERLTLVALFNEIKKIKEQSGVKISDEDWNLAIFSAGGIEEQHLPRVVNNALSSMFFPPFTTKYEQVTAGETYKIALLHTLVSLTKKLSSSNRKDEKRATQIMKKLSKKLSQQLNLPEEIAATTFQGEDFANFRVRYKELFEKSAGKTEQEISELIKGDSLFGKKEDPIGFYNLIHELTTLPTTLRIDFSAPHFTPLEKLRIFVSPPDKKPTTTPEAPLKSAGHKGVCRLFKGTESEITNAGEFGSFIKETFMDVLKEMDTSEKAAQLLKDVSDEDITKEFTSFYTPLQSCYADLYYPEYNNTPWNFQLRANQYNFFWATSFGAEKAATEHHNIQCTDNSKVVIEVLEWAKEARQILGSNSDVLVPVRYGTGDPADVYPGHAFVLTPNHPSMLPQGNKSVETMLQEKMQKIANLKVSESKNALKEVDAWVKKYVKDHALENSFDFDAFKTSMHALVKANPSTSLHTYLNVALEKMKILALPKHAMEDCSAWCFHGLLEDVPGAGDSLVIHAGDTQWDSYLPKGATLVPVDFCFYPNPFTLQWAPAAIIDTPSASTVQALQFPSLNIMKDLSSLKEASQEKHLLLVQHTMAEELSILQGSFSAIWERLEKNKITLKEKIAIKQILDKCSSLNQVASHLTAFPPQFQELIQQKISQQKLFEQFCKNQIPPVDPANQTLSVTRFEATRAIQAFDASSEKFLQMVRSLI
ncbi:MAG: hypothetical protein JWO53_352 [Chlamydiia bacterium]|nr:hypothetical protein [Chlamydiia bacterium]